MIILETIAVAFSMYSALPMPQFGWNDRNMKYALCAFPLIGIVIGAAVSTVSVLCRILAIPELLRGAVLCLLPVLITGGIHLDGYADTCDALASHGDSARKLEIMKDPHIGSFAVIRLCCYFLLNFVLWCTLEETAFRTLAGLFILSRALSGLAVCTFPLAKNTGLAHLFALAADRKTAAFILSAMALCAGILLCLDGLPGVCCAAAALLAFAAYHHTAVRQFGGITGDLAGWFLQRAELFMLAALCICRLILR